jgi:hypothetical protein
MPISSLRLLIILCLTYTRVYILLKFKEKYHLINTGPEGQHEFNLDLEILKILESEKRPKTVITIIGPARSGKSFLMNMFNGKSGIIQGVVHK